MEKKGLALVGIAWIFVVTVQCTAIFISVGQISQITLFRDQSQFTTTGFYNSGGYRGASAECCFGGACLTHWIGGMGVWYLLWYFWIWMMIAGSMYLMRTRKYQAGSRTSLSKARSTANSVSDVSDSDNSEVIFLLFVEWAFMTRAISVPFSTAGTEIGFSNKCKCELLWQCVYWQGLSRIYDFCLGSILIFILQFT